MPRGFIRYETKKGVEYGSHYTSKREGKKVVTNMTYLGRVVDKENGVFKNRDRGIFTFSLDKGFGQTETSVFEPVGEKFNLDFGDCRLLDEMLKKSGFHAILDKAMPHDRDTLRALVAFKLLDPGFAFTYAQEWLEGSYARIVYPKAAVRSQRISEFLKELGDEANWRKVFTEYLAFISENDKKHPILIDSTGLPNDIKFPLSAVNNHNGVISNEARLILVVDRITGMPLYFRYAAGNIIDVSTLKTTLKELAAYGVDVNYAVVDAGCFSEDNIKELNKFNIPYITRLVSNRRLYKKLLAEHANDMENAQNMVSYRDRVLFAKRVSVDLYGKDGYAYVMLDLDRKHDEIKKYALGALGNNDLSPEEMNDAMKSKGLFVLISAKKIEIKDILPMYYTRQSIEQVFDIGKNNADLLPLRCHGEETFRGHLMLSFLATTAYIISNKMLEETGVCAMGAFHLMRRLKVKIFENRYIVQECNRKMNDIIKHLKFTIPTTSNFA
jgi:hypothetical protein